MDLCNGLQARFLEITYRKDNLPVAPWLAYNKLLFVLNEMVFLFES